MKKKNKRFVRITLESMIETDEGEKLYENMIEPRRVFEFDSYHYKNTYKYLHLYCHNEGDFQLIYTADEIIKRLNLTNFTKEDSNR